MTVTTSTPPVHELDSVVATLAGWQRCDRPAQLHPGDLGWFHRFGARRTARALRTWSRAGQVLAIGLLDGPDLLRLEIAPEALHDEELARQVARDATVPGRGVLPEGEAYVAAPPGALVGDLLARYGWEGGDRWTPLRRELDGPVPEPGVHVEVVGPEQVAERTAVQRSAFAGSTFTDERWHAMAAAAPYAAARCLLARDDRGEPVAAVTVWSAGAGRPGLIEPMGVHADHRGRGHGRAIVLAAARALQELGCSSVVVDTPSANTAAVATYQSAGLRRLPELQDLRRTA
ncbi:GNAT family N-acetyltransferase [Streptomyces sp. enrichment culture]|uniref:GNAT family N-acetyltransferase n=1 Tax=Streptomyces sp. enrichment culture TaxID=1795815 RepID=UPI003F547C09